MPKAKKTPWPTDKAARALAVRQLFGDAADKGEKLTVIENGEARQMNPGDIAIAIEAARGKRK